MPTSSEGREAAVCAYCRFPKDHPWHVEGATASSHTFAQPAPTAPPPAAPPETWQELAQAVFPNSRPMTRDERKEFDRSFWKDFEPIAPIAAAPSETVGELSALATELRDTMTEEIRSLRARLATAEAALADRDRHFMWDERLRMEREIGDLATRLATAEAERDRLATEARQATQAVGAIVAAAGGSVIVRPSHIKENWLVKRTEDGTGTFWYFAERIGPPDEPQHVCGLRGYNPMIDPMCPACVPATRRAPSTGTTP